MAAHALLAAWKQLSLPVYSQLTVHVQRMDKRSINISEVNALTSGQPDMLCWQVEMSAAGQRATTTVRL
ncbi:hypothetical protein RvY_08170 [Ramazzottius varieornatus]|uniref:Uncharacterized protein n=1 Tax=Ramazzottius varieornatus TaxID=947166 RepID=A0A1D1V4W1_RAMVA|nr:hypothetical protein RvY_08170 [Ramazzottius varieornatus]